MFSNLGSGELVLIAILVVVLFGTKKLNELARGLGESVNELKKMKKELDNET